MSIAAPEMFRTGPGLEIQIRPATEFDEKELVEFYRKVSEQDRRFRFLTADGHVGHEQLEPLIHIDHFRSESYLAFETREGDLVATGQLVCDNPLDTAEVAISVRSDYKGKGIAWTLLDVLAREAEKRGVRRVISIENRENRAAIELEREKGFALEPCEGDPSLVVLSKTFR